MSFFKCKVCSEKDSRIADLKSQIAFLKSMVAPINDPENPPSIHLEADGLLSGQQHVIEVPESPQEVAERQAQEEASEASRLLSATY